ncbi:hypothetical protein [Corynebacterium comes]|uniref:Uncharacterized protein n=1 Tax=Corynebacterium comes TaxID=2675218 RepID=A0A6B8W446_9CORY|nr:hypothetical protein [Corynebacterium comes]QGU04620.1 hypothetical protein CETAM_06790 [Corynebacterium comes]
MSQKNSRSERSFQVPLALRVGGAFMALAVALLVFTAVALITDGWMTPYVVTPRFLIILVAVIILGAFATVRRDQAASRAQVIALIAAVVLVMFTRLIPNEGIYVMEQYWLAMYAVAAFVAGLVIRRSLIPKG